MRRRRAGGGQLPSGAVVVRVPAAQVATTETPFLVMLAVLGAETALVSVAKAALVSTLSV